MRRAFSLDLSIRGMSLFVWIGAMWVTSGAAAAPGGQHRGVRKKQGWQQTQGTRRAGAKVAVAQRKVVPSWKRLVRRGSLLSNRRAKKQRWQGVGLLLRAHRLAPHKREAMVGAARAYMLLGFAQPKRKARWGKRGLAIAKRMIRRWPQRAEGYLWSAIHTGLVAQGISPMSAFFQGLHKKIEAMAKASIRRDPKLYQGAAQRLLGRFFFKLPWPMKRLKQSRRYLAQAHQMAQDEPNGLLFYGETLLAMGHKRAAKRLFRRCAKAPLQQPWRSPAQIPVGAVVAACQKRIQRR